MLARWRTLGCSRLFCSNKASNTLMVLIVLRSVKFANGFLCFLSTGMKNCSAKTQAISFAATQVRPSAGGF